MPNAKAKCRYCGERFPKEGMKKAPLGYFCSYKHAALHGIEKSRKAKERQQKKEIRQKKEALKTKSDWVKEAQKAVNRYIRARDRFKNCISCGVPFRVKYGGSYDAGHYRSRGAAGHLRFNLLNIAGQCVRCNRDLSGNAVEFRKGLIERIGKKRVERIEYDNSTRSFTVDYLKRLKKIFNKRARWYEKRRNCR